MSAEPLDLDATFNVPFTFDPLRDPEWTPDREDYRHMRDGLAAHAKAAQALLDTFIDDEPCSFDHHGYCQTHGWFHEGECNMARARRLLGLEPA